MEIPLLLKEIKYAVMQMAADVGKALECCREERDGRTNHGQDNPEKL